MEQIRALKTHAYHEIWLDEELVAGGEPESEPIYGPTYLPRKFKTGFAVPPSNDVDIFSQDLGFIAIIENDQLVGYNVTVGGGLGMNHGNVETFPRLADVLGFIAAHKVNAIERPLLSHSVITAIARIGGTRALNTRLRIAEWPVQVRSRTAFGCRV